MALLPTFLRSLAFRVSVGIAALFPTAGASEPAAARQPAATIIVVDSSGSMRSRIKGGRKIAIVRQVVSEVVQSLPDDFRLGLVTYGRRESDCDDVELLIPPRSLDKAAFRRAVNLLHPRGQSSISSALRLSAEALRYRERRAHIVLIVDGEDTCGAEPCETARLLTRDAASLTIHMIGLDLSARDTPAMECAALATEGHFFEAHDAASLRSALAATLGGIHRLQTAPAIPAPAMLKAPATVLTGAPLSVEWAGPDGPGDYLTIVPRGTPDGAYRRVSYTTHGSPLDVAAPDTAGPAELRYVSATAHTVLARREVEVLPDSFTLSAPDEVAVDEAVSVEWTGPSLPGDYVTIVPKNSPDERHGHTAEARHGSPLLVTAPGKPGPCEIRYVCAAENQVRARRLLRVTAPAITLRVPPSAQAGASIEIGWTGPDRPGDFITIVPATDVDGRFAAHAFTQNGAPARVAVPPTAGPWEVRYMSGKDNKVLARTILRMAPPGMAE